MSSQLLFLGSNHKGSFLPRQDCRKDRSRYRSSCGLQLQVGAVYQAPQSKTGTAPYRILWPQGNERSTHPTAVLFLCNHKFLKTQEELSFILYMGKSLSIIY